MNSAHKKVRLPLFRILRLLFRRKTLRSHDAWTGEQVAEHQQRSLDALRNHAYTHSGFYKRFHSGLFDRPLNELPVLTKKELMANWDAIVTDKSLKIDTIRKFVENLEYPLLYNGEYIISTTSGTTGLKGVFAFNNDEWLWGLASHGRATEWAGAKIGIFNRVKMGVVSSIKPWCKSLLVGASVDTPILPTLRLDSTTPMNEIVKQLNNFQPEILVAYAGTGKALAKQQIDGHLKVTPKMVFTSSELLSNRTKEMINSAWGKQPYNAYACTEGALIAADCQYHKMHLCEDLVIAEVVDKNNQPVPQGVYGDKLLITVLFSRTIPLIRYEVSDNVMLADKSDTCTCGRPFRMLAGIQGRVEDIIYLMGDSGRLVAIKPDVFHDVLEPAPLGGWQIIQETSSTVLVSIIDVLPEYNESQIIADLTKRLEGQGAINPKIRVQIVEKLQQSAIGKIPLVKALKKTS